jgi:hypothetical protein
MYENGVHWTDTRKGERGRKNIEQIEEKEGMKRNEEKDASEGLLYCRSSYLRSE